MEFLVRFISQYESDPTIIMYLSHIIMILFIVLLCVIANFITKKVVLVILTRIILKNRFKWDNIILERKVFRRLSHLVPAIIISLFASTFPAYQEIIEKGVLVYVIIVAILVMNAFLDACNDIYRTFEVSKEKPIRGYIQVIKIFVFVIAAILMIANLLGQNPLILLSGLGAISAVLMLVFKDSLLGLVAGIQLSTNDMVRVGDWIEMPKYNADGDVIDISLNTVKVMNFDKTVTMIPSYALISDSFKNWRGMTNAGGRRIKRAIHIDTSSICFCTEEMIASFRKIHNLTDYITEKEQEILAYNKEHQINLESRVNGRKLTNIGVFRVYIFHYLKNHPQIHKGLTLMVRQLAPEETGLPLEIYAFTADTKWTVYENVQSDIFDHLFAVAPEFGLRIFQKPTGHDLKLMNQ